MIYAGLRRLAVRFAIARNVLGRRGRVHRALVSYIVHPFLPFNPSKHHTNVQEARAIVDVLDSAGFSVDVVDSRANPLLVSKNYDLYFGFGDALERVAKDLRYGQRLVAYATGRAAPYQSAESIRRGIDFQNTYGTFPKSSLRLPGAIWQWQITLANAVVIVGDHATERTFDFYPANPHQIRATIPATFSAGANHGSALALRDWRKAKFNLMWFGGAGVVHKGLDLCIAALSQMPQFTLHVCGVSDLEKKTVDRCIEHYEGVASRIKMYGFIHPHSRQFGDLASQCAFTILPSCSEGQATSVLTSIACGGLIPLVSDRCGCSEIPGALFFKDLTVSSIVDTIAGAARIDSDQLQKMSSDCVEHVLTNHKIDKFKEKIRIVLREVIESNASNVVGPSTSGRSAPRFRIYKLAGKPIFAAPRSLRIAAIQRLQPTTTRRSMYRRALRLSMFANLDTWLGNSADGALPLHGDLDFPGWLDNVSTILGVRALEAAVFWPPQRDRGRVYVHLFDAGWPVAFAKVSLSSNPDVALLRESATLRDLQQREFTHFQVPHLIIEGIAPTRGSGRNSLGCSFLLMEPTPPSAKPIRGHVRAFPRNSTEEYSGNARTVDFSDIPFLSWWDQYRTNVGPDCRHFDDELSTLLTFGIKVCRAHGDLSVNNIVDDGERLWIFDWEESRPDAPLMTDEIGFALSTAFRQIVRTPQVGMRLLRKEFLQSKAATSKLDVMLALAFRHSAGIDDATAIIRNWRSLDER